MSDEIQRIQRMVAEGKVTPEEGAELMASVAKEPPKPLARPLPAPAAQSIRASWIVWPLVGHGILFLLVYAVLVIIVPKFEEIFKSFGVQLPVATTLILAASRFARNYALLALPLGAGALALDTLVYALLRRRGWHLGATLWWLAVAMIALAAVALMVSGLFLVQMSLMEQVGNQAGSPG